MAKTRIEKCDKAIENLMAHYFRDSEWKNNGGLTTKENLSKFKKRIDLSLTLLVLMRCTNSDIINNTVDKSDYDDKSEKETKSLKELDNKLFRKQLATLARQKKNADSYSSFNDATPIEIKGDCVFKSFQKDLGDLVDTGKNVTIEKLKNLEINTGIILRNLRIYQNAKKANKAKSDERKIKFLDIFVKSVQNFEKFIKDMCGELESKKIIPESTQIPNPKTESINKRLKLSETYEQEGASRDSDMSEYSDHAYYGDYDEDMEEDEDVDDDEYDNEHTIVVAPEEDTEKEPSYSSTLNHDNDSEEEDKEEDKHAAPKEDTGKEPSYSSTLNHDDEKAEVASKGDYNIFYLLLDKISEKPEKGLSLEEKIKCAKDTILHATACFIGACKYAKLECERLYAPFTIKIYRGQNCLHLSKINWDKDLIKSLNKTQNWKKLKDDIDLVYGRKICSDISDEKNLENLIRIFSNYFYNYDFVVAPNDGTDEVTQEMKLESHDDKIDGSLIKNIRAVLRFFGSEWSVDEERYLGKLITIRDRKQTGKVIEENEKVNDKKRNELTKYGKANRDVDEELKERWSKNIKSAEKPVGRKTLAETIKAANEAHEKLKKRGILFETDNSRGEDDKAQGYSHNFAKLFIRYLERSFPELDKYVKIYFYANPPENSRGIDSEISDKYWKQVDYYKSKSKSDGITYFIVNEVGAQGDQEVPINQLSEDKKRLAKGNKVGHGNLTVICNGKYKVFETVEGVECIAIGSKNFGKQARMSGVTIQADTRNCLAISLGYLESILKQLSKEVKNKNEELEKEKVKLKNKESEFEKDKEDPKKNEEELKKEREKFKNKEKELEKKSSQGIMENMDKQINRFSTVELPDNIFSLNKMNPKPMKILLPTKYIKYLQSRSTIDQLLEYIRGIKEDNEDYDILQEVKSELERVTEKYTPLNEPIKSLIGDMDYSLMVRERVRGIVCKKGTLKKMGLDADKVTISQLTQKIDETCERMGITSGEVTSSSYNQSIVDYGVKGMSRDDIEKELNSNPIYELWVDYEPIYVTVRDLYELKNFSDYLKKFSKKNLRAQMKRRTETLKIATLVEALDDHKINIADEIDAVRDFTNNQ